MPNHQKHRGQQSKDKDIFNEKYQKIMSEATNDMCYLLEKKYPENATLKLVGDHYQINERQRKAVFRCACPLSSIEKRQQKMISNLNIEQKTLAIDGYNLLIIVESMLSNGYIFKGRDGAYRDVASIHGTYKKVEETLPALTLIANSLIELKVKNVIWYLDSPISNSGRLKSIMLGLAEENYWNWEVELVNSPDKKLVELDFPTITADAWILDNVTNWFNLSEYLIQNKIKDVNLLCL
ncbi:MAG: DUF434 domain-containing protein [Bacteroidetes bacterium]|nr:MAG: DUF434 domain-containing protein [Bacteroidota bacterium]TAG85362.1 MAG: DUF434 domain-containing protein [Bacteroidota bacterium]